MMPTDPLRFSLVGPIAPYRGGIAQFTEQIHRGLAGRGHAVETLSFSRQYPAMLFPGRTQFVDTVDRDPETELPAPRVLDSVGPLSWRRTARRIAQAEPDAAVFMHWMPFFAPAYGTIARQVRRRGVKALALIHNALPHESHLGERVLSRYLLRALDGCVVLSDAVETNLRGLGYAGDVRVVAHPVYDRFGAVQPQAEARASLGIAPELPVMLFFGMIRPYKGLSVLLDAVPRIVAEVPDALLIVAGEFYDDEAPYRAQVERHGLADAVRFVPEFIPEADVARYFSAADVVVQPYASATQSGVAQVAYQFERPLVVTDVGGLPEIVPHERCGLVVPPRDPEALGAALARFFREDLGAAYAENVRAAKAGYSWEPLYDAFEDLAQ